MSFNYYKQYGYYLKLDLLITSLVIENFVFKEKCAAVNALQFDVLWT
jgi:hypothetical protein